METVRFHAKDTLFALLVTYLKLGVRDLSQFDIAWVDQDRSVVINDIEFPIVRMLIGQPHEVPGVNLVFYEETQSGHQVYNRLATIHVYTGLSDNPIADDRTLDILQRKIDEALYGKGCPIYDFDSQPYQALSRRALTWDFLNVAQGWQELTDLASKSYLHRARSLLVTFADATIT